MHKAGNGVDSHPTFENFVLILREYHGGEVTTVPLPEDSNALRIYVSEGAPQVRCDRYLVLHLYSTCNQCVIYLFVRYTIYLVGGGGNCRLSGVARSKPFKFLEHNE